MDNTSSITRIEPNIGARVDGIVLTADADEAVIAWLRALLLEHHVIVLPGQHITSAALEAFGKRWGELLEHPKTRTADSALVQLIASKGVGDRTFGDWHSDMTWHPTPPIITMLHAVDLPGTGGDTIFANQHLALDTLPDKIRDRLEGVAANHSGKAFGPDMPETVHPAIRTHDESGRRALYLNMAFTTHIEGMDPTESRELILRSVLHATRPEFAYRHKWSVGDLVIWDNRSVMHCPIVDYTEQRVMHRVVVKGDVPR